MIQFEEIDKRLKSLGKSRAWLTEKTPYSADYLRTVLAPRSQRRTARVQQIISDAIEAEEARQRTAILRDPPNDTLSIQCGPHDLELWIAAANAKGDPLKKWAIEMLNNAANIVMSEETQKAAESHDPNFAPPEKLGNASYPSLKSIQGRKNKKTG
jgi:lambda repressor-like predicted transcriptional regulator